MKKIYICIIILLMLFILAVYKSDKNGMTKGVNHDVQQTEAEHQNNYEDQIDILTDDNAISELKSSESAVNISFIDKSGTTIEEDDNDGDEFHESDSTFNQSQYTDITSDDPNVGNPSPED